MTKAQDGLTPLQKAFIAINGLRGKIDRLEFAGTEPIAIVGMGCRLPGADNPDAFWDLLRDGRDMICEVPRDRWDTDAFFDPRPGQPGKTYSRHGGFLSRVDGFDAAFFGISAREAEAMDPQQRLLLEVAWETFEDAGLVLQRLSGSRTGVFVGVTSSDYGALQIENWDWQQNYPYFNTGTPLNACAGRLAFVLGLQGPCMAVDTACSSALTAIHLACASLRNGECDQALTGGVNLILTPRLHLTLSAAGMLAPDGRCKTFGANANGYVRGEGCGLVALKRYSDAKAAGDRIHALILGSAANQDGASSGFTVPNGAAQKKLIEEALNRAKASPAEIDYVEAHGTGTALGDLIEAQALGETIGQAANRERPLLAGSVKSNIGHLESAAGAAGLIKLILALQHQLIPPTLHATCLNPDVPWDRLNVTPVTALTRWPRGEKRRLAGLSSFGASGSNAHLILAEAAAAAPRRPEIDRPLHILALSAKSEAALRDLAQSYEQQLVSVPDAAFADMCFSTNTGRSDFSHRLALSAADGDAAREGLAAFRAGRSAPGLSAGSEPAAKRPRPAFVFSGQSALYPGMGRKLYENHPSFRRDMDACADLLEPLLDKPLLSVLYSGHEPGAAQNLLGEPIYGQPALFALQYALAGLWQSFGVEPAAVLGEGLGEYCAACVAGVFSLKDGLRLAVERARLMQHRPDAGGMAAVLDAFERFAQKIDFKPPALPLISNLTGKLFPPGAVPDAAYWRRHCHEPVLFAQGLETLHGRSAGPFIEIGPANTLAERGKKLVPSGIFVASLKQGENDWQVLLASLGEIFVRGCPVDWTGFDAPFAYNRVSVPTYPFQRKSYWFATKESAMNSTHITGALGEDSRQAQHAAVEAQVVQFIAQMLRVSPAGLDLHASFLEMGADSLVLVEAVRIIDDIFGVKLEIRQFFEEITTITALAGYLADRTAFGLPPAAHGAHAPPVAAALAAVPQAAAAPGVAAAAAAESTPPAAMNGASGTAVEQILLAQMQVMSQQLALLKGTPPPQTAASDTPAPVAALAAAPAQPYPRLAPKAKAIEDRSSPLRALANPITPGPKSGNPRQERHIAGLIERYQKKTPRSKELAQACRPHLADSRASIGFRFSTKEILYPITGAEALGSHLRDIDGNTYIDLTMGFGVLLFGNRPEFMNGVIEAEIARGFQLGPRSDLMQEVAALFTELTGHERAGFTNSGTEAVMIALRLARTATGRSKIALFEGSYHGHSDGTLAKTAIIDGKLVSEPSAPGVPPNAARDVLVLEYGTPETLEILRIHAHELAAVLVEPVQSRRLGFQPVEFLRQLRALTEQSGTALIFDEMITGFRAHLGGCQALFGVAADIAAYGKIIGGGMPIGAVAGKSRFLDGIDGGMWRYGDKSYPGATRTYFGGTFCQHPFSMAACLAALRHLKQQGPALQERLNRRTADFANILNTYFTQEDLPLRVSWFASVFRFEFSVNLELLFYHLLEKGVYIWEWRNCFLSTAHTDEDIAHLIQAVKDSVEELREGGFLPERQSAGTANAAQAADFAQTSGADGGDDPHDPGRCRILPDFKLIHKDKAAPEASVRQAGTIAFGFSYFGPYNLESEDNKYNLLIETARYADSAGFQSLWIPERHFHEFGGFSPNPSVLAAALARETSRISLRAGSVVLPLHDPVRVAEEWSLVDNLSGGRVGIAFAPGWHPNDFVFAPDAYGNHRELMFQGIETVSRLWRGETITRRGGEGSLVELGIYPRPQQQRLPCWVAIVKNPNGFRKAGEAGLGVLTNLMSQSLDDLAANVKLYRQALAANGHDPSSGSVVVLIHTYLRADAAEAVETARQPMCDYLLSSIGLFQHIVQTEGKARDLDRLTPADKAYLVAAAYEKYAGSSALIGSPQSCAPIVARLIDIGIDELACFIDFGVAGELVLEGLPFLNELRTQYLAGRGETPNAKRELNTLPVSEAQRQLWILARLSNSGSRAYSDPAALSLRGHLDKSALRRAMAQVVARHEALRTTFDAEGERQLIHPAAPIELPFADLSAGDNPWVQLEDELRAQNQTIFDLASGPLFRAVIYRLEPERHVLFVSAHHIISDGHSMSAVLEEVLTLYAAERGDAPAPLAQPLQFRDFLRWQDEQKNTSAWAQHKAYWLQRLSGPNDALELPGGRPRPPVTSYNGARETCALPPALLDAARKAARQGGATLYMVLLAAYSVFLYRLSGQNQMIIGAPYAGRGFAGARSLVGYCSHLLPIAIKVEPASSFSSHLREIRSTLLDAYEHQDFPFAQLLHMLNLKGDSGRAPLVNIVFNLEQRAARREIAGLEVDGLTPPISFTRVDLTLTAHVWKDRALLECDYNTDLFDAATIRRWLGHYLTLLNAAAAAPEFTLAALPLLTPLDYRRQVRDWNKTPGPAPAALLHTLFEAQAAKTPDRIALIDEGAGGASMTYRELDRRSNRLAHHLHSLGAGPGQTVGICLRRSWELMAALLATLKAGAAFVPLDPAYPSGRIALMQKDASIRVLLTQSDLIPGVTELPDITCCLDREWVNIERCPPQPLSVAVDPRNLAYVMYTSGSTGKPKGVMISHDGIVNYLTFAAEAYAAEDWGGAPVLGSISFDATLTSLFAPLLCGQQVTLLPEGDEIGALASLGRRGRSFSFIKLTPAHLKIFNAILTGSPPPEMTRHLVLGGEALPGDAVEAWLRDTQTHVVNEYGPTETVVGCCVHQAAEPAAGTVPIGRPVRGTRLFVLDGALQHAPPGVAGELYIGGAGLARGYLDRPGLTAAAFVPDPYAAEAGGVPGDRLYKTGDLARYRPDGTLVYTGRADRQLKLNGFRIEPGEVEALICAQPEVQEAAVVAREDQPGFLRLVAYVRPAQREGGLPFNTDKLREALTHVLPHYMIPSAFVTLAGMPMTPNGKIDRKALPPPDAARPERDAAYAVPRTELEQKLAAVWQDVLGLGAAGINDNFFDLGGNSLLLLKVHERIAHLMDSGGEVIELFKYPTIASLAGFIAEGKTPQRAEPSRNLIAASHQRAAARLVANRRRAAARSGSLVHEH